MLMLHAAVTFLIAPFGTAIVLGTGALISGARRHHRWAAALGLLALLWLWAWATPAASHALRGALERPFPPLPIAQVPSAPVIVVLGGGISPPHHRPGAWPDLHSASDRVWHAARLYHAGKSPLLLLSGGSDPAIYATSEAEAMKTLLLQMGVPASAMLLEETSRTTQENARESARLLQQRGVRRIMLVTSALHMQRALALFQAQGLEVTPVAADHEADDTGHWPAWRRWLPTGEALEGSGRAIKEWVGRQIL